MRIIVSIGGNALIKRGEKVSYEKLVKSIKKLCAAISFLITKKHEIVLITGSGPQIGALLLQNELAQAKVPPMPLDVLDAELQGQMQYLIEQELRNVLQKNNVQKSVVSVITQVVVRKNDPRFKKPSKPVGPYYTKRQMEKLQHKYKFVKVDNLYRRVVPSPKPVHVVECKTIKALLRQGMITIAAGGGGIPVVREAGKLRGVRGVIDKDAVSACLAKDVKADVLLIITDVPCVYVNYKKKNQKPVRELSIKRAQQYVKEGQFSSGSMLPKIEAAIQFVKQGGKRVIITSLENVKRAYKEEVGTVMVK